MKTIEQMWKDYAKAMPDTASEIQVRETRRAFYSAIRMFSHDMMSLDENMPDDQASEIVKGWEREMSEFYAKLMMGLA